MFVSVRFQLLSSRGIVEGGWTVRRELMSLARRRGKPLSLWRREGNFNITFRSVETLAVPPSWARLSGPLTHRPVLRRQRARGGGAALPLLHVQDDTGHIKVTQLKRSCLWESDFLQVPVLFLQVKFLGKNRILWFTLECKTQVSLKTLNLLQK